MKTFKTQCKTMALDWLLVVIIDESIIEKTHPSTISPNPMLSA
jgi:hypothetical protein